jgi:hypothetical protein
MRIKTPVHYGAYYKDRRSSAKPFFVPQNNTIAFQATFLAVRMLKKIAQPDNCTYICNHVVAIN